MKKKNGKKRINSDVTNGAKELIEFQKAYAVRLRLSGTSDLLFHRWNAEAVDEKSRAAKNSRARKSDDIETYVWRNEKSELCIPGEYVRMAIVTAAKFKQDPRSPRKSAMDLFKAGVVSLTQLATLKTKDWDYLDKRRVMIQRSGVNRTRPAMRAGWSAEFEFEVLVPEYIDESLLHDVISTAGRLVGIGDFRPSYGRFKLDCFEVC